MKNTVFLTQTRRFSGQAGACLELTEGFENIGGLVIVRGSQAGFTPGFLVYARFPRAATDLYSIPSNSIAAAVLSCHNTCQGNPLPEIWVSHGPQNAYLGNHHYMYVHHLLSPPKASPSLTPCVRTDPSGHCPTVSYSPLLLRMKRSQTLTLGPLSDSSR